MQINNIGGINRFQPVKPNKSIDEKSAAKPMSFSEFLKDALGNVNQMQMDVQQSDELLAAGKIDNLHQVMVDTTKAEVAMQFTVQIRNKIMDAYNEIMRMQV